ncbi:LPXTG cell wall anchor domain-containing protein [Streptomyces sp. NPDC050264]|uniref:LPXTG cell wall anchor domain-containing protein n=1 Tax=Streptomyces sp. NPDC050264 TaxID=3155038 RepID=UPI003426514B
MSHRPSRHLSLRSAAVAAAVAAGVLVPAGTALASDTTPKPVASDRAAAEKADKSPAPARDTDEARKRAAAAQAPRGGVAAGERPATGDGSADTSTALIGSLSAAALLAGAGTVVLRRRASQR